MFESSSDSIEFVFTEYDGFKIRLLKDHSLWSHILFNASKLCQRLIKESVIDVRNKSVLELGSGSGLASMQCLIQKAQLVVVNDFPDVEITENLNFNVEQNFPQFKKQKDEFSFENQLLKVKTFFWGRSQFEDQFDIILISDCIQVIKEHENLILEINKNLKPSGECFIFYQHHQQKKIKQVEQFFEKLKQNGFSVKEVCKVDMGVQFIEDEDFDGRNIVQCKVIQKISK